MEKTPDVDCKCGHPGCRGRATWLSAGNPAALATS